MELYQNNNSLKLYGAVFAVMLLTALVIVYSGFLAKNLRTGEHNKALLLAKAFEDLAKDPENTERDVTISSEIIAENKTIPIILVDEQTDEIRQWNNFPQTKTESDIRLILEKLRKEGAAGISFEGIGGYKARLYYKESILHTYITLFPYFILLVLLSFMGIGYISISSARQAEQNRVWVGMAKETAHQLGTPISAIVAWIEHLRSLSPDDEEKLDILRELDDDVARLDLIADRFSKIGSAPLLERKNLVEELHATKEYMQRRASRRVKFHFPSLAHEPVFAEINAPLFNWVIENLLRNSLDAMDGEGDIHAQIHLEGSMICIDITDTGRGIPLSKQKLVFKPGFTTKKRGWGLGLSLARRIVEEYHRGKIFVKRSDPGHGTTFSIKLPLHNAPGTSLPEQTKSKKAEHFVSKE